MTALRDKAASVANDNISPKRPRRRSAINLQIDTAYTALSAPACRADDDWQDPASFSGALDLHMRRFGETSEELSHAIARPRDEIDPHLIDLWRTGRKVPRGQSAKRALERIERRYRLPTGYFINKVDRRRS